MKLQKQLKIKADVLVQMARDWMPVAAELKIWTFYETIDTNLTDGRAGENDRVSFQAPITSIKSAILELHHEVDRPVLATHADCAAFGPDNEYTKRSFLRKLSSAATQAKALSLVEHKNIVIEKKIDVEVHGFFESIEQNATDTLHKKPMRLWSTINSIDAFMRIGPAKCLQNRLQENTIPPTRTEMLNAASSRRTSFRLDTNTKPVLSANVATNQSGKGGQKSMSRQSGGLKLRPLRHKILSKDKEPAGADTAYEGAHRRLSLPSLSPTSAAPAPTVSLSSTLADFGHQNRESASGVPSVLVSEHEDDEDLALAPSTSLPSNRGFATAEDQPAAESRRQLRNYPTSEVSDTDGTAPQNLSTNRNERLSPFSGPPRPNLNIALPALLDNQQSDDSETESNHSNGGEGPTAGPPRRPDPDSQKLVWIHLAYNNPKWVSVSALCYLDIFADSGEQDVFSAISKERGQKLNDTLLADTTWCKRHIRGRNTHYHACFVKPGCILIHPELSQIFYALSNNL